MIIGADRRSRTLDLLITNWTVLVTAELDQALATFANCNINLT